jgi:hypothetical protein
LKEEFRKLSEKRQRPDLHPNHHHDHGGKREHSA